MHAHVYVFDASFLLCRLVAAHEQRAVTDVVVRTFDAANLVHLVFSQFLSSH